jgi:hypothetical protein
LHVEQPDEVAGLISKHVAANVLERPSA